MRPILCTIVRKTHRGFGARKRASPRVVVAVLLLGSSLWSTNATARNPSAAEMLFQAGRDAMVRGDLDEACLKFKESNDIDQAPGTVLNLGNCEEQRGRVASAWEYFTQAMEMLEHGDPRYIVAEGRAVALEKRVPRLVVELSSNAPSASRVYLGGKPVTTFGQPLRLDPGEHTLTVEAPGYNPGQFVVTLSVEEVETIAVAPGAHVALRPSATGATPVATMEPNNNAPLILLGAGALSLVGAGVLGSLSYVRWSTVKEHCDLDADPHVCDATGLEAQKQGKTMGIIAAGLGVVALTSAVLYFTLPLGDTNTTVAAGQFGTYTGVNLAGTF